jgi:WD40 repeat protein
MNDGQEERASPYQGLAPYLERDAVFFFGRERERDLITANLMASRLTILYGISGVGKSSVLRAGAAYHLNRLADQNRMEFERPLLAVAVFSGWSEWRDNPAQGVRIAVDEAVARACGGPTPSAKGQDLLPALEAAAEAVDGDVMLVLDQFEEYFLYRQDDRGHSFEEDFVSVVNATSLPVSVLVSIREDSVTQLRRFKGRIPHLLDATLHVDYLSADAARDAIVEPVAQYNRLYGTKVAVEPQLVKAVVHDLAKSTDGQPGRGNGVTVSTPYLQLVMTKLWTEERRAGSDELRVETLERLGEGEAILRAHLDERMAALTPREQAVAARMFHQLVTPSGAKVAHNVDDLAAYIDVPPARLRPVLERLADRDARILSASEPPAGQTGGKRYEIFHDLLAAPVLEWRSRFLESAQRRRIGRLFIAAVALIVVAAGAIVFAVIQRGEAEQQERRAEATQQRNAELRKANPNFEALLDADDRPLVGVEPSGDGRLALGATRSGDALIWTIGSARPLQTLSGHSRPVQSADFDRTASRAVTASLDGTARIWDVETGEATAVLKSGAAVFGAAFDNSGRRVVTAARDGTARLWNLDGEARHVLRHSGPVRSASFDPTGTEVLTASDDGTVRVWLVETGTEKHRLDAGAPVLGASYSADGATVIALAGPTAWIWTPLTDRRVTLRGHRGRVLSGSLSFDGHLAVTGGADGTVRVWDARSGRELRNLVGHRGAVKRVVFGRRGQIVASASADGTARIWAGSGPPVVLAGHRGSVNSITFDRAFTRALTAGNDGTARLWRVPARQANDPVVIGRSVERRAIRAVTVGNTLTGRSILVVGCMHGDECAGTAVVRRLETAVPTSTALVLVEQMNPDGAAVRSRGNARGVDLNRNFPYSWRANAPGSREFSGPTVLSEPESRAVARLIRQIRPAVAIWYHQRSQPPNVRPPLVDESGGDVAIERRYAELVDLPLKLRPRYPGGVTSWQNQTFPGDTAFVVELRYGGPLTSAEAKLHARAVRIIAHELR